MKISAQNYYPSFKTYQHTIKDSAGHITNRGDTCMFRYDLDLNKLIDYMDEKYKNVKKVNVIVHACSDGEEAYSIVAKLLYKLGYDKSKKYLPLTAKDICKEHVELAKNGEYIIEPFEQIRILLNLHKSINKFFKISNIDNNNNKKKLKVNEFVKSQVNFNVSNIIDDIKNTKLTNTILFARNFWIYLTNDDAHKLVKYLAENSDDTTLLVLGDFDKLYNVDMLLSSYGFKESYDIDNVFYNQKAIRKKQEMLKSHFSKYIQRLKNMVQKNSRL